MGDNKNKTLADATEQEKLEWIETYKAINALNKGEGLREKMTTKIRENPFVPVGMLATTLALSFGLYAMKSGNKRRSQLMMRVRIYAQGFTVAAILIGIVVAAKTKPSKT